jgi:DNA-binding CsgD family transcriptional regulator
MRVSLVEDLVKGREAFERREWVTAYEKLREVDPVELTRDDVIRIGMAAHLAGDHEAAMNVLERGYRSSLDSGDTLGAVRIAFWVALALFTSGDVAVGGGWVARAQRLMEDRREDVVEGGYLLVHEMFRRIAAGDLSAAADLAPRITACGRRFADSDLLALGLSSEGRLAVYGGRVREGLALLDEAMLELTTSRTSPVIAGTVYCSVIEACQEISDFVRVEQWTSELSRWCESQPDLVPFTGQCAVHRGQVMRAHGALSEALHELELALDRYRRTGMPPAVGLAMAERADILRLRGAYGEAEAAYTQAHAHGHDPQPGLALLWLARGRVPAALMAVRRLMQERAGPVQRSRVLPAAVEVLLAGGDLDGAREAALELSGLADLIGCAGLRAAAAYALGSTNLAEGDLSGALRNLHLSMRIATSVDAPYEIARARVLIGRVFRELGDEDSATTELTAALGTLRSLGTEPLAQEAERLLVGNLPAGLTLREVEVLRLVAAGKSTPAIASELFISEKTVARHLSNIFTKIGVASRTAAAAYAFEHHLT